MTSPGLERLARRVFASLNGTSAATLYSFSAGLDLLDKPASDFARSMFSLALERERKDPPGSITTNQMGHALKSAAVDPAFVARLEDAESPFWRAVAEACAAIREDVDE